MKLLKARQIFSHLPSVIFVSIIVIQIPFVAASNKY